MSAVDAAGAGNLPATPRQVANDALFSQRRPSHSNVTPPPVAGNGNLFQPDQSGAPANAPPSTPRSLAPMAPLPRSTSASSTSQLLSGSPSTPTVPISSTSNNSYQTLSLADAVSRCQGDLTRALDEVLSERNRFCLEAGKLSHENVRIWNLMGKIRKENEALKVKLQTAGGSLRGSTQSSVDSEAKVTSPSPAPSSSAFATSATPKYATPVNAPAATPSAGVPPPASDVVPTTPRGVVADTFGPVSSPGRANQGPVSPRTRTTGEKRPKANLEQPRQRISPGGSSGGNIAGDVQRNASNDAAFLEAPKSAAPQALEPPAGAFVPSDRDELGATKSAAAGASIPSSISATQPLSSPNNVTSLPPVSPSRSTSKTARGPSAPIMVSSPSTNSLRLRLQPRDAVTASPSGTVSRTGDEVSTDSSDDEGRIAPQRQRGMSLTQALASLADTTPPISTLPLPRETPPRLDNRTLAQVSLRVTGSNLTSVGSTAYLLVEISGDPPKTQGPPPPRTWRIEKSHSDVAGLDAKMKHKGGKTAAKKISSVPLPEKALFKDHAPSKVDLRKAMLEAYLRNLLSIQLTDKDDLCAFLCTDVVPLTPASASRSGFLTKKGQNLGRWISRFYVLEGPRLDYFDTKGGACLGSIQLRGAQIGRQQKTAQNENDENSYRHAFLVLEKGGTNGGTSGGTGSSSATSDPRSYVRHVLCAESDQERDEWVDVLVKAIAEITKAESGNVKTSGEADEGQATGEAEFGGDTGPAFLDAPAPSAAVSSAARRGTDASVVMASHDSAASDGTATSGAPVAAILPASTTATAAQTQPTSNTAVQSPARPKRANSLSRRLNRSRDGPSQAAGTSIDEPSSSNPLPSLSSEEGNIVARPVISSPMNGAPIPEGYKFGARDENVVSPPAVATPDRRRFWHRFGPNASTPTMATPVFGVPLSESLAVSSVSEGLALPSVVYRCIEFLEKRNAIMEEGIYRLSGSTADIRALRDRFNAEGDVDLLNTLAARHDPHAVAGLLKTFLRELPTSVLTRDLHLEFTRINDVPDWKQRVRELAALVAILPVPNYSLLRTLCRHLIKVISYQDQNKMTMRNVGIVFSPTLGIPAGVFALFLTSFDYCFDTGARTTGVAPPRSSSLAKRPIRNSMHYSEEEAQRLLETLPLGSHRIMSTHPEDPTSYDAEADFMGTRRMAAPQQSEAIPASETPQQ
ncbi:unnamed protein product [Jaminaea pallidilutea]